jgi:pyruvate/2-oxoglutarate dehydrogenase complex dihydrolipoamide dehydrogenase (E3) component
VGILASDMVGADPSMVMMICRMAKRLSKHVTIYTNNHPDFASSFDPLLRNANMTVDTRSIASVSLVEQGPQVELTFSDGSKHVEGFLVGHPKMEQRAKHLVEQLGLETTPSGEIQVTAPWNETSLEGCYAAGDAMTPMRVVVQALQTGGFAGGGLATSVQKDLHERGEL